MKGNAQPPTTTAVPCPSTQEVIQQIYKLAWRAMNERPVELGTRSLSVIAQESAAFVEAISNG